MGKYYVQSGTLRTVVQAESSRRAAIWAVHQAMQQILPLGQDPPGPASAPVGEKKPTVLAATVRVSERGYDRDDAVAKPTLSVVAEWNEMVTTLDRLERLLAGDPQPPLSGDVR